VIELNRGAQAAVHFDARTRWVELEQGEAHFTIAKDGRPFVVTAGGVLVQAVGTVFKVRIEEDAVDVLVTEGQVKVGASIVGKKGRQLVEAESLLAELNAGHRSVVGLSSAKPATSVVSVTSEEIERELSWLEALLDFRDEPLSSIVMEFNRRNSRKIVIEDPAISDIRLTAAIRPNNIDGLVELLELTTPVRAKSVDDNIVILSR
jgi:transmembrane sensor